MEMTWVEATLVWHSHGADPQAPADRSQRRLVNLAEVVIIAPSTNGDGRTVFSMRDGKRLTVVEPYEYWSLVLTSSQPRPG